jgi:hypothetical protein
MYVYNQETLQCLFVIEGAPELVEWEAAAHFEQNGTPAQATIAGLHDVANLQIVNVGEAL